MRTLRIALAEVVVLVVVGAILLAIVATVYRWGQKSPPLMVRSGIQWEFFDHLISAGEARAEAESGAGYWRAAVLERLRIAAAQQLFEEHEGSPSSALPDAVFAFQTAESEAQRHDDTALASAIRTLRRELTDYHKPGDARGAKRGGK